VAVTNDVLTGTFSGAAQSDAVRVPAGGRNISLAFASTGTVNLERSFDQGGTWKVVETYTESYEGVIDDPQGASYRLDCDAAGGNIVYRIG
jgi:hypothetical protein